MSFIRTYTGSSFDIMAITPSEIRIDDIATSLSRLCRYGGHCSRFYSVAEHSVHVATYLQGTHKDMLAGLLHDASEAYVGDMIGPLKGQPFMKGYRDFEAHVQRCIEDRFKVDLSNPRIHEADKALFRIEFESLMDGNWSKTARWNIECWNPEVAREKFTNLFLFLYQGV